MKFRYHAILGKQMVLIRWPSEEDINYRTTAKALIAKLEETNVDEDFSILGDLVPTEKPLYTHRNSIRFLEESFKGDPDHLPGFDLWDYRQGRFVTVTRPGKKALRNGR